jgi:uncharacterized membrane protein
VASQRWDAIDIARGLAIVAMIGYHFTWDLSFLRLIATNIVAEPAWQWFARSIAGSFLVLAGIGLALAHAQGFRRRSFLRRLVRVGGAALAVTLVTYFAFPESYIFFGVLHCIALSSVLALPFLLAPAFLTAAAAIFCVAAPWLFTDPTFDRPLLDWLGLGSANPVTNDYVPIFPWFGLVLAGVILGKAMLRSKETLQLARWRADGALSRAVAWAGRRSLPIYLLHQPILLALLYGVLQVTGPDPVAEARPFMTECQVRCVAANGNQAVCRATCSCVVDRLKSDGLWPDVLADRISPSDRMRVSEVAQQCLAASPAPQP